MLPPEYYFALEATHNALASCQWFCTCWNHSHFSSKCTNLSSFVMLCLRAVRENNHIIRYITPPSAQMHVIYFIPRLIALTEFIFKCPQICITLSWADGKVDWSYFRRLYKLYMRVLCSNSFMRWVSVPQIRHLDCDCSASVIKPHKLTNSFITRPCSFLLSKNIN